MEVMEVAVVEVGVGGSGVDGGDVCGDYGRGCDGGEVVDVEATGLLEEVVGKVMAAAVEVKVDGGYRNTIPPLYPRLILRIYILPCMCNLGAT